MLHQTTMAAAKTGGGIKDYDKTVPARESVSDNASRALAQIGRCIDFVAMIEQHVLGMAYSLSATIRDTADNAANLAAKLEHLAYEIGCK